MTSEIEGFKLKFAERSHHPAFLPGKNLLHGGIVNSWVPPDTSIILGEKGKKNFEPRYCPEEQIVIKKQLPRRDHGDEEVKRGKRCVAAPAVSQLELAHNERVHYPEPHSTVGDSVGFARKKSVLRVTEPKMYNLEATMNRKQRVPDETAKRNGIAAATPGDKSFKQADREPEFYAKGGIIPGSTITLRQSAKPELKKRDDVTKGPGKKLEATYGKLVLKREKAYDLSQVHTLTKPSKTHQGEVIPSWEERTGQHLVDPDDESVEDE
mmetsp:Transcript_38749/g.77172  ORF Transcript_38749/g.77172 Transcript_38749/m.77172 type:complete len:267 (+) Transcript_38749:68-868(+)